MDIPSLPKFPGGPDPGPSPHDRRDRWFDSGPLVAAVVVFVVVVLSVLLVRLVMPLIPLPVLA